MTVDFVCPTHGSRPYPKPMRREGWAVDVSCEICGVKCNVEYSTDNGKKTHRDVYPTVYEEKK